MRKKLLTLIFVYNANSDFFSSIVDVIHKIVSPKTYQCNLCAITYGAVSMKQEWKKFIDNLPLKSEFLHRDEFFKKYKIKNTKLPKVFIKKKEKVEVLISSNEIDKCKNLEDLKNLVENKLKNIS